MTMVQEPETSFADDVTATKRVLDLQDGPTLLVGHSYGGSVITEAGVHPNVVGLVYVAAHAPDVGENAARSQVLAAASVFSTPLTAAAWKTKPSWGIVAGGDQRSKARVTRCMNRIRSKSRPSSPAPHGSSGSKSIADD